MVHCGRCGGVNWCWCWCRVTTPWCPVDAVVVFTGVDLVLEFFMYGNVAV